MKHWLFPSRRTEATSAELAASGALGSYGVDPVDGDRGYQQLGVGAQEMPAWSLDKSRILSLNAYRSNPMGRAIIDTYTAFAVGDSGVTIECSDPDVRAVVDAWWNDPRNQLAKLQPDLCRDWMLNGEAVYEMLVGDMTGVVRYSPIDPRRVTQVDLLHGNVLWPSALWIRGGGAAGESSSLDVIAVNDESGLRQGQVGWWPSWKALLSDRRGSPFLTPVLDDLDSYATVLSNLIDRTALARYLVWDVKVTGDVDAYMKQRGNSHIPQSGSLEVHNENVEWTPKTADTGSFEDTNTAKAVLVNVAGGVGLAKTWLADPEDANRATALSMAEPVRRRVGGVQNMWLDIMTEFARFTVDRAVAAGRLPSLVPSKDAAGQDVLVPPSQLVRVRGPQIAAADAQVVAGVMVNLATALETMVEQKLLSPEAAQLAAQKAWEQFVGTQFRTDLSVDPKSTPTSKTDPDDAATDLEAFRRRARTTSANS